MSIINDIFSNKLYYLTKDNETTLAIKSIMNLKEGWDFGEGIPTTKRVINVSLIIYAMGHAFGFSCEAHPLTNGGIELILFIEGSDHFLNLEINPDLSIYLTYEIGIGVKYDVVYKQKNVNFDDILKYLIEIKSKCNTSASYQSTNTAKRKKDSAQVHSEITGMEFQLST